jgi:hypothetical protein
VLFGNTYFASAAATSDPQALAIVAKAMAALTGGNPVSDASLSATAIRIIGPDYVTGSASMIAKAPEQSRVDYMFGSTTRSEIRDDSGPIPSGSWVDSKGAVTPYTLQNCLSEPVWFFPALSFLSSASNPSLILTYVGRETWNDMPVEHIRAAWLPNAALAPSATAVRLDFSRLSTVDMYLDAATLLPDAMAFKAHPDSGADVDIPIEVRYANYQPVSGVLVPMHVQELMNGSLLLDLTVTRAAINTGASPSKLNVQ